MAETVHTYVAGFSPDGERVEIMHAEYLCDVTATLTERIYLRIPDARILTGHLAKALWDAARSDTEEAA